MPFHRGGAIAAAAAALVFVVLGGRSSAAQPPPSGGVRALRVVYADGRTTVTPISDRGRVSWTTTFPRVPGAAAASADGLPLSALQFEEAPDGETLVVTLALLYGRPQEQRVKVTTVRVTAAETVRVDALEAFGVQPLTLAIVTLPPSSLYVPSVSSPSSQLELSVDLVEDRAPAYHVTIGNYSTRAVMMLAFKAYRGNTIALSGQPRGTGHVPLIDPKTRYVLKIGALPNSGRGPSGQAWMPVDRIEITSVLWSDGLVEGDPIPAAEEHALDAGTAQQLGRILGVLRTVARDPGPHRETALREQIAAMPIIVTAEEASVALAAIPAGTRLSVGQVQSTMQSGMRNARSAVLNDIDEFIRDSPGADLAAYARWLGALIEKFDGWRTRIAQ